MSQQSGRPRLASATLALAMASGALSPAVAQDGFTMKSAAEDPAFARRSFETLLADASPLHPQPLDALTQRRLGRASVFTATHATRQERVCEFQEIGFEYEPTAKGEAQMAAKPEALRGLIDADVAPTRMTVSNRYVVGPKAAAACGPSVTKTPISAGSAHEAWRGVTGLETFLAHPENQKIDCLSRTCPMAAVSVGGLKVVHGATDAIELSGESQDGSREGWRLTLGPGETVTLFVGPMPPT